MYTQFPHITTFCVPSMQGRDQSGHQLINQLPRLLRRNHNSHLRIHRQRRQNTRINNMQVLRPDDRRVNINTRPDPARTAPMIDLSPRVWRPACDIADNLRYRSALLQIQWREARPGQSIEQPSNKGRDILCVLRVTVVNIA